MCVCGGGGEVGYRCPPPHGGGGGPGRSNCAGLLLGWRAWFFSIFDFHAVVGFRFLATEPQQRAVIPAAMAGPAYTGPISTSDYYKYVMGEYEIFEDQGSYM